MKWLVRRRTSTERIKKFASTILYQAGNQAKESYIKYTNIRLIDHHFE